MGNITIGGIQQMTWIPSYIIKELLRETPGDDFKVLTALFHIAQEGGSLDTEQLAGLCGLTVIDVISACEYWNQRGVLTIRQMDSSGSLDLVINSQSHRTDETGQIEAAAVDTQEHLGDPAFRELVSALEMVMGKPMSPSLLRFVMELKDSYHFDDEVIMLLFSSCRGKENLNYLEKVALSWRRQFVQTGEEAHQVIRRYEDRWQNYRELFKYMGMDPSVISEPQQEQMDRWFDDYGFDLVLIKHAAQRCINQLGRADLNYIEGILKRWKADGIQTVADAIKKDKPPKGGRKGPHPKDVTSFNNYEQRNVDYDSLEKKLLGWEGDDE
ncbi:Replication initiation and membrane attachment [anaerobic digester metagenome]